MDQTEHQPRRMGSLKRSWVITKSAWKIFTLDKEILWVPFISGVIGLFVAAIGFGGGYLLSHNVHKAISDISNGQSQSGNSHLTYAIWIITSALLALLSTYTLAAMIAISLKRLRGGDPTVRDGVKAVRGHLGALTLFSLFSFGIIQILQILEQRLPFFGKLLAFLGDIAWRVAAFFAVPIIVDTGEKLYPIEATKQSMHLIRQTWRESGANQFVMGTIFALVLGLEFIIGLLITAVPAANGSDAVAAVSGVLTLVVIVLTILVSSAMEGIAKAVLYYYAVTGEAPAEFDKRLLQEAFTPKKARKIFG